MVKDIFTLKKDGASILRKTSYAGQERHQQIFNFQSSIFNSGLSGLGFNYVQYLVEMKMVLT